MFKHAINVFVVDRNGEPIPEALVQLIEGEEPVAEGTTKGYRNSPVRLMLPGAAKEVRLRATARGFKAGATVQADEGNFTFTFEEVELPNTNDPYKLERRVALFTAVALVGTVVYLVIRNEPIRDPNLAIFFRIVLSLGIGILGASIPGFLNLKYNLGGFAIRAGGAMALFVITFFGTPRVAQLNLPYPPSPLPTVQMDEIGQVDLRSELSRQDHDEDAVKNASALLTVPLSWRSTQEPAKRAIIDGTTAELSINGTNFDFTWDQFVNMHEENYGKWLGIIESVHPLTVDPGAVVHREVLHRPVHHTTWDEVVNLFVAHTSGSAIVTVRAATGGKDLVKTCRIDLPYWSGEVQHYIQKEKTLPGRITMLCLPPA